MEKAGKQGNPYAKARRAAKMSSANLAKGAEVSFSTIWALENGLVRSPNPRIAAVLAAVGIDTTGIEEAYRVWRERESKATIQKFANAR